MKISLKPQKKERKIAVLRVESINYSIKPEDEKKAIIYAFQKFLNSLDFPIQILMHTGTLDLNNYLNTTKKPKLNKKLKKNYQEYEDFLKKTVWDNHILNKNFYIIIPETTDIKIQIQICEDRLNSLNLRVHRLNNNELEEIIGMVFSCQKLPRALRNNIACLKVVKEFESDEEYNKRIETETIAHVKNKKNKIDKSWHEKIVEFHRIIYAHGYPRMVESGFLDKLVSCAGNFDLSLHIQPCSVENTMVMLNKELQKQRADLYAAQLKGQLNPSLEIKYADTHRILEELQKGNEKLFNIGLYLDCKADTLENLNLLTRKIESELNSLLIIPRQALFRMLQGFRSCMPFGEDKLLMKRNITTSALSAFFPFTSSFFKFDPTGVWLGSNKNNIPIIRDIFKLSNANGVCLATSGSGKSYMAKLLISRYLLSGVKVIVIDPQGEYTGLVKKFGGQRVDLSRESETMINPLDLMGENYNDKRLALMDLMPIMLGDLSDIQKAILDSAITKAYEGKGIVSEESITWGKEPPILEDLLEKLIQMEKRATQLEKNTIRSLVNRLNLYVKGVFSFLNKQTKINLNTNFICFDIGNLPKQVKPTVMFLVLEYIYKKMKNSLERKLLVIDEAWSLLSRSEDAGYILEIVKTCRKFNLGLFLINQEVENMLDSQAGRSVLANTSYTLLLRQKPAMIKSVQNIFHLSESEKVLLLTARPGEGLLLMDNDHSEIKIVASKSEHEIITTNADELLKKQKKPKKAIISTKSKIKSGQRVYVKKDLDESDLRYLISNGFKEVKQTNISGKKEEYMVINERSESPNHIICIKEIVDYLKQFTNDIKTYQTTMPDIVFNANGKYFAIEVETGEVIKNKKRMSNKIKLLNEKFEKRWFFFVTNRNLKEKYLKLGATANKRNIKFKIRQIFKNSKK
jgi:type IV secretory pathway VirB4 component